METIYSRIIWDKLNKKDYKIHLQPWQKTDKLICQYFESLSADEIIEFLEKDMSWIDIEPEVDYYDGHFHKLKQKKHNLKIHDCGLVPTLLHIILKLNIAPSELVLLKKLLEIYLIKVKEKKKQESDT